MWLEGYSIPQTVEASDYTQEFFAKNEHLNKEHLYDPLLVKDPEDNDMLLDHCTNPWLRVDGIEMDHEGILAEAMHLLDTACFTYHRPQSAGWMSLCIHGISTVHTNCADDYGLPDDYEETDSHWTDIAKFCPGSKNCGTTSTIAKLFHSFRSFPLRHEEVVIAIRPYHDQIELMMNLRWILVLNELQDGVHVLGQLC